MYLVQGAMGVIVRNQDNVATPRGCLDDGAGELIT